MKLKDTPHLGLFPALIQNYMAQGKVENSDVWQCHNDAGYRVYRFRTNLNGKIHVFTIFRHSGEKSHFTQKNMFKKKTAKEVSVVIAIFGSLSRRSTTAWGLDLI